MAKTTPIPDNVEDLRHPDADSAANAECMDESSQGPEQS
jgi:hypothetical protein